MGVLRVLLALVALTSIGLAQTDSEGAKRKFEEGTRYFNLGEFKLAAESYKAAYMAKNDSAILYNIAQAYRLAADVPQALFFYRSYLRNTPNASNRREVEDRISALEEQQRLLQKGPNTPVQPTPTPTIPPPAMPPTATPPPPRPEPKPAPVVVVKPEPKPAQVVVVKPEPKPAPVVVVKPEPKPAPVVVVKPEPVLVATPAPSASRSSATPVYKKWWLWTIVGVVVVGGAVGAGVAVGVSRTPSSHFGDRTITF